MKRNILGAIWVMGVLSFAGFCLSSCTPELDVQQAYDFSLQTLPVQKDIIKGAVAEIRCSLKAEGDFKDTRYTIRYFQPDGKGGIAFGGWHVTCAQRPLFVDAKGIPFVLHFALYRSTDD